MVHHSIQPVLQLHWEWLQNWQRPDHWNWHKILRAFDPLHWILAPLFGMAALAFRRLMQRIRENRAINWPMAEATVQAVSVKPQSGYWVEVQYRYFARDEYRYGKFRRHFRRKPEAESFAAAVRRLKVPVHFSPEHPDASIVVEDDLRYAGQVAGSLEPG